MSTISATQFGSIYYKRNLRLGTYVTGPTIRPSRTVSATHQDSTKRVRPVGEVALFQAGTSYSHERLSLINGTFVYFEPNYMIQMQTDQITGFGWSQYEEINWKTTTPINELKSKLLSKARSEGVNVATMMGEYRETANLFVSLAKDFTQAVVALKRMDPRYLIYGRYYSSGKLKCPWPKTFIKECSDRWLQFVWGISPLVGDMQSAWDLFRTTPIPPLYRIIRASTSRSAVTNINGKYNTYVGYTDVTVADVKYSGRALVYYKDTFLSSTLANTGITNPLAVAYELTPFSWLLDYWINMGDVIASLDNALVFQSIHWNYSTRYRYRMYRTVNGVTGVVIKDKTSRTSTTTLSMIPPLYYKESVSARHVANVLAVLQGFRK